MRRFAVAVIALALLWPLAGSARADDQWCVADPIFYIQGREVRVTTSFPRAALSFVRDVRYQLEIPRNVSAASVVPPGQPVPETIVIELEDAIWDGSSPLPVGLSVTVRTRSGTPAFPVAVTVSGSGVADPRQLFGVSDQTLHTQVTLP